MLTDTAIRAAKPREKSYKLFDGLGLYLEIAPTGSKLWRLKYRHDGRENRLALGAHPVTAYALKLAPLLFVRPGELRHAEWTEFDLDGTEPHWRIPAEKMKMGEQHIVPLAKQAGAVARVAFGDGARPVCISVAAQRLAAHE